jgi:type IV pilus assembly protein PilP
MSGRFWVVIGVCAVAAARCAESKKPDGVEAAPKQAPVARATAPDAGTAVQVPYAYSYNPLGKRDPFRSMVDDQRVPTQTENACKDPLCQWDLDQLVLVGVVSGEANPLAMVEDPMGRGYVIRRNTRIGKQGGKVSQILRDMVTVTELWTAPDGKVNPNPISLRLKADKNFAPVIDLSSGKQY